MATRILLVEDHPAIAEGLSLRLNREPGFEVVDIAFSGSEAVEKARQLKPDLVVMDISMPRGIEGIEATQKIRAADPAVRVLILTAFMRDRWVEAAVAAGAGGYLSKEAPTAKLIEAIKDVLRGRGSIPTVSPMGRLTPREQEVLQLVAEGLSDKQIAVRLGVKTQTVKNGVSAILDKLGAENRTAAVQIGIELGEITQPAVRAPEDW